MTEMTGAECHAKTETDNTSSFGSFLDRMGRQSFLWEFGWGVALEKDIDRMALRRKVKA